MKIWYDTEFIDDGNTIDLISIGLIRADGEELYLINRDVDLPKVWNHDWLRNNVLPHLPAAKYNGLVTWNELHPDYAYVKQKWKIANQVAEFIQGATEKPKPDEFGPVGGDGEDAELNAWYAAYDHVVLAQLWGPRSDLPPGIPTWTRDLKQECDRLERTFNGGERIEVPSQPEGTEHHALHDARRDRKIDLFLQKFEMDQLEKWAR